MTTTAHPTALKRNHHRYGIALSLALLVTCPINASAATLFWFGDEGPLWNTVGNWGLGASPDSELPQDGDTLRWISGRARANLNMTNDFVGLTVANINQAGGTAPPPGIVFNGNLLRWTGTIHSLDSDVIYNLPLEAASSAVTLASGGTFNGVISEATAGTMVSFASGTISLNASNTWSGISRLYTTVHIQSLATKDTPQSLGQGDIEFGWFSGTGSLGSTLVYTGPATLTDKGFMIGRSLGTYESRTNAFLNNGAGAVMWAGPQNKATSNRNPQTFRLGGTNADNNDWQSVIENNHVDSPIGILKTGPGTWILSGDNTYTGPTTISAGWLRINGDQSAATGTVTVEAGAALGGSGSLGGDVTLESDGALKPADTGDGVPDSLTIDGAFDYEDGTLDLSELATLAGGSHVLATFPSRSVGAFADVVGLPSGASVSYTETQIILAGAPGGSLFLLR